MADEILLTREGYEKISYGDISENAEYDSAKNEQAELEERILKLENMMRKGKIIENDELTGDHVNLGLTVKVKDLEFDEVFEYSIVGSTEADPFEGKISNESLVGKGLLGKKVGDIVEINAEVGPIRYEVLEIYK